VLTGDACFIFLITIRSHNLHVDDIKKAMSEIASDHERDYLSGCFGSCRLCIFWHFFGLHFFLFPL